MSSQMNIGLDFSPLSMQTNVATFGNLAFCQERLSSFASKAAVTTQNQLCDPTSQDWTSQSPCVLYGGNSNAN